MLANAGNATYTGMEIKSISASPQHMMLAPMSYCEPG